MKKAPILVTLSLLALAFTLRESTQEGSTSVEDSSYTLEKSSPPSLSKYTPNLQAFQSNKADSHSKIQHYALKQRVVIPSIFTGSKKGQLGVSNNPDMQKIGPGAFLYIKKSKVFVVLDNENNRLSLYPRDGSKVPYTIKTPRNRQSLGLTLNSSGEITLLSRQSDPNSGVTYPYYEIWSIDEKTGEASWVKKTQFSFSDRKTHGSAQSLDMQSFGDSLLFKGLSENEYHILKPGEQMTHKFSGHPTHDGTYVRSLPSTSIPETSKIVLQEFDRHGTLKNITTNEDMTRLNGFKVLKNGLIALDLEADTEKAIPRELILISKENGEIIARSHLRPKDNIYVDQDLFYGENSIFQLAEEGRNNEKLQILQTELEPE